MLKTIAVKTLSILTSFALLIPSFSGSASAFGAPAAVAMPEFVKALTPSKDLGYVVSSYDAGGATKPRLIVLADLHGHIEVQKNLMGMMESLVGKLTSSKSGDAQQRVPIFIEGGWTPNLEEPLAVVKDPKTRAVMAEYLIRKAEISAGQGFSERHVGAKNFTITGVENFEVYEANRKRFAETYPMRKAVLTAIAKQEQVLSTLEKYVEPRSYVKLKEMRQGYLKGLVPAHKYARVLHRSSTRLGIQSKLADELRQPEKISDDRLDLVLSAVHGMVSERLAGSRPLSSYLRPKIQNEEQVRMNVAIADGSLDLLKRVLGNQLTPEEVPFAIAQVSRLAQVAEILLGDQRFGFNLEEALRKSLDFYAYALLRDKILAQNALTALDKDPMHPTTGILIAGGFHTGSIAQFLKEQHVPHMVIHPILTRDLATEEQLNYIKRICNDHVTPSEVAYDMRRPWGRQLRENNPLPLPVSSLGQTAPAPGNTLAPGLVPTFEKLASDPSKTGNSGIFGTVAAPGQISAAVGANILPQRLELINSIIKGGLEASVAEGGFVLERKNGALRPTDEENKINPLVTETIQAITAALGKDAIELETLVIQPLAEGDKTGARAAWDNKKAVILMPYDQYQTLTEQAAQNNADNQTGRSVESANVTLIHEALHNLVEELRTVLPEKATAGQKKEHVARERMTQALAFAARAGMIQAANDGTSFSFTTQVTAATVQSLFNAAKDTFGDDAAAVESAINKMQGAEDVAVYQLALNILLAIDPQIALANPQVQQLITRLAAEKNVPRTYVEESAQAVFSSWGSGIAAMKNDGQIPPEDIEKVIAGTEKKARGWFATLKNA